MVHALRINVKPAFVLAQALPDDDEVSTLIHRHSRVGLVIGRGDRVDEERTSDRSAIRIKLLCIDPESALVVLWLLKAGPGNDVIPARFNDGNGWKALLKSGSFAN